MAGSKGGILWSGIHKGGTPFVSGLGVENPCGRTPPAMSRDSKGRLWSPFSEVMLHRNI
jgi:hypothetical protein